MHSQKNPNVTFHRLPPGPSSVEETARAGLTQLESEMKKIVYVALLASSLPVAAFAGGMAQPVVEPVVAPPAPVMMAPSEDWTGVYAGATLAYGRIDAKGGNDDGKAAALGLDLGYRRDFGTLVVGGEVSLSKNDLGIKSGQDQINSAAEAQLSLGADLGKTLVYVAGGVARASASLGGNTAYDNGYFGAVGADYMLNDKWTVGGELKSSKYNDFDNSGINLKDTSLGLKVGMRF